MITRRCDCCKEELPIDRFHRNGSKKDGYHATCKTCKSLQDKKYRDNNKDKLKIKKHEYYLKNREATIKRTTAYMHRNRDKARIWSTRVKNKVKTIVFSHYCDKGKITCQHCNKVEDLRILSIDHINGNGNKHRKEIGIGNKGGYNFYRWLKRNGYPEGFQVLCFNCQYRKRRKEMAPENPTEQQKKAAARVRLIKLECLDHYGGHSCPCGEKDMDVLTLDHVNNDGADHRRELGAQDSGFIYICVGTVFRTMCLYKYFV
jgi:hypothetical protein